VAHASVEEIDELNILHASMLAMQRAIETLSAEPSLALIDGNRSPLVACATQAIIKGDDRVPVISAASVLAKVARDALMVELAEKWPGYGFEQHKGYGTALHRRKLQELGVTPAHRRSFAPVRAVLQAQPAMNNEPKRG
jgi:ribonuclease HII